MITVTSTTAQILQELRDEEPKAIYWLKKMCHGEKGYGRMQTELIARAKDERKNTRSDVYDYISPKGNRWMVFEHCRYHKDIHYARAMPVAFCYYETYGSVGAFLNGHDQYSGKNGGYGILFTDHFFLRFCQRLGIEMRSRWMVQRFLEIIPGIMFNFTGEKDQNGRTKVDCRFPASIGRGVVRNDGPLIEIRTYLTDPELTNKQKRDTKNLRKIADRHSFDTEDVKMARMLKSENIHDALEYEIEQLADMGCNKESLYQTAILGIYIVRSLIDLKYADANDFEFWIKHGEVNNRLIIEIADSWEYAKPIDDDFVSKAEQIFKNDGIKKYDLMAFINHWFDIMRKDIEEIDKTNKH